MFELSVALQYLIPRRRQLSVSIISLLSILVVGLVVWLILTFLSVTRGIEERWLEALVALNGPMRLTPTDAYYASYYHQIDGQSLASGYSPLSLEEKRWRAEVDPYDPLVDGELPPHFPHPDLSPSGELRDPVRGAFASIEQLGGRALTYEIAPALLRLQLLRKGPAERGGGYEKSLLSQIAYIHTLDETTHPLAERLAPLTMEDLNQTLRMIAFSHEDAVHEGAARPTRAPSHALQVQLKAFFAGVEVEELTPSREGMPLDHAFISTAGHLPVQCEEIKGRVVGWIAEEEEGADGWATFTEGGWHFTPKEENETSTPQLLLLPQGHPLKVKRLATAIDQLTSLDDLSFEVEFAVGPLLFSGIAPLAHCDLLTATTHREFTTPPLHTPPFCCHLQGGPLLLDDQPTSRAILLPHSFAESQEVRVGDRGYLAYHVGGISALQEQRIPVQVAGFYDPGLAPVGTRLVLGSRALVETLSSGAQQLSPEERTGIQIWPPSIKERHSFKATLLQQLEEAALSPYWKVETFDEYEFAQPLVQQFQSDRLLFSFIALLIIAVACTNIISMLILLVNDKRREIGILRAMGASSTSVGLIFALCGGVMGSVGSLLGLLAAIVTLHNLNGIVSLLSSLQGHEFFQSAFYGKGLPVDLSPSIFILALGGTLCLSLIAALIPALKAASLRPSEILRS